jgi:hypothetical protein
MHILTKCWVVDYRKYSSFLPNHASPDADLTLPSTYLHLNMRHVVEDYELKQWIMPEIN